MLYALSQPHHITVPTVDPFRGRAAVLGVFVAVAGNRLASVSANEHLTTTYG
ncbi:hypothetical protein GCM10010434_101430 [Winogradskya humida]